MQIGQGLGASMPSVYLTQSRTSKVCDCHFELVKDIRWSVSAGYAKNRNAKKMHRLIAGAKQGEVVDHINGDTLDNRCSNLRICTQLQNAANRKINKTSKTGYKGVRYDTSMNRTKNWAANIYHQGKRITIGRYSTPEEAAVAYNKVAKNLKGEFARLNVVGS